MYAYPVEEVVLTEIVANALDAKATRISIDYDPAANLLVVEDNGLGMDERQFDEYHDFAAGLKARGSGGIGFAGVGAKVSFNIADRVLTETISAQYRGGSDWYLSGKRLVWEDGSPRRLRERGTRVEVRFKTGIHPYGSDSASITRILEKHYLPLLDPEFLQFYADMALYSEELEFRVNGSVVPRVPLEKRFELSRYRHIVPRTRAGKRFALGKLGLSAEEYPLGFGRVGVLLCTHGKVIKAEMFNQFPGEQGPRITGIVEAPAFVQFLTTTKSDFTRVGKGKQFNALYNPIRSEFEAWLKEIGVKTVEYESDTESMSLERELRRIAEDIPEIGQFFGFTDRTKAMAADPSGDVPVSEHEGVEPSYPTGEGTVSSEQPLNIPGDEPGFALDADPEGPERAKPVSRKARRGPRITFLDVPESDELSWIDGDYVCINKAHPAYQRSSGGGRTLRIHNMFAIGSAIQRFLAKDTGVPDLFFIDRLMAAWGRK